MLGQNLNDRNPTSNWDPREAIPPWEAKTACRVGGVGVGACGVGALLALSGGMDAVAAAFCAIGLLLAGIAVRMRFDVWPTWALGTVAGVIVWQAAPVDWESLRLIGFAWGAVSLTGTILVVTPWPARGYALFGLLLLHFGGIMCAVTGPPPQPWLSGTAWVYVYRPYLQFMYLNNAYQFYSPDPGPAILIWTLVEFETDDEEKKLAWFRMPQRPPDVKDPLAMTYYRRLALTEHVNPGAPSISAYEFVDVQQRRKLRADIPENTPAHTATAFHPPTWEIRRRTLPSYVREIARIMSERHGMPVKSMKFYRIEHRIVDPVELSKPEYERRGPYHPTHYLPYYFGDYDAEGNLLNSKDPLLYWLLPILPETSTTYGEDRKEAKGYDDSLSKHAGEKVDWSKK